MGRTERVGISLESKLLSQFDRLIARQGYSNRSEAIRDLIRDRLTSEKLAQPKTRAVAAVFIVYDHHHAQLAQKLIQLQHSKVLHSIASMHIHLDRHNCLEVVLLRGTVSDITSLGDQIVSLKGVHSGQVNLIAADEQTT